MKERFLIIVDDHLKGKLYANTNFLDFSSAINEADKCVKNGTDGVGVYDIITGEWVQFFGKFRKELFVSENLLSQDLTSTKESSLINVITKLKEAFKNDSLVKSQSLLNTLFTKYYEDPELYDKEVGLMFVNMTKYAAMPWLSEHPEVKDENVHMIHMIFNGTLSHFVRRVIESKGGTYCSENEESFIIEQVKEAIYTNSNRPLYQSPEEFDEIDKAKWNEQAYWSPSCFKDTDDVIKQFNNWYEIV